MTPGDAAMLFVRLCLCGPLLYIGLVIAIDPASLERSAKRWPMSCARLSSVSKGSNGRSRWLNPARFTVLQLRETP